MDTEDRIKLYGMSHSLVERDLDKIEQEHHLDLQRSEKNELRIRRGGNFQRRTSNGKDACARAWPYWKFEVGS